ncbi:restriction endonuclease [Streptomyces sp. NPDC002740]
MIIDRTARVVPPRYPDREIRRLIGDSLGKADQADLLAAYLWVQEAEIGRDLCAELRSHRDALRENLVRLRKFKSDEQFQGRTWKFARAELDAIFDRCIDAVGEELALTEGCLEEAISSFESLRTLPEGDLAARYAPGHVDSPLNTIADRWHEVYTSSERISVMAEQATADIRHLKIIDDRRKQFAQSGKGYTLQRIEQFDAKNFEILVAWLTHRDGMKVTRQHGGSGDRGADVISLTPDGRRVVVQCKQTSNAAKQTVTSTNVQTFNGTARLEHKADIALMVTNGTFSEPAREFASDHAIHLIDAKQLECWATWGDSLYEVLGIHAGT